MFKNFTNGYIINYSHLLKKTRTILVWNKIYCETVKLTESVQ